MTKAYEQVAARLREEIHGRVLPRGARLPNEVELAEQFGVSRATVREALRLLAAQNLIRTAKGAGGGSYVTVPSAEHLSESLQAGLGLLTASEDVTLDELLEARALLEVPAAELAARRRAHDHLERLRAAIPGEPLRLGSQEQFVYNADFHSIVIEASGNTLLAIAAQPIFAVLQTHLARSRLGRRFHAAINRHHREIVGAIEEADERAAREQMAAHLEYLRPYYEQAWRAMRRSAVAARG
ncbi:MAG TPA: GntR family transcriptional regulator [Gaiellaceae bacterium]|nr:GntR family transcriptional regulator [Gaiellaceae bacterium]